MAGYQYTVILGNVGRDPEMRYTQGNVPVTSFSVAVTERWTDRQTNERKEKTNWYRVTCWRNLAEIANNYIRKGTQILVTGTVSASAYIGPDNQPRATLELTAQNFQLLGSRADGGNGQSNYDDFAPLADNNIDDIPF